MVVMADLGIMDKICLEKHQGGSDFRGHLTYEPFL